MSQYSRAASTVYGRARILNPYESCKTGPLALRQKPKPTPRERSKLLGQLQQRDQIVNEQTALGSAESVLPGQNQTPSTHDTGYEGITDQDAALVRKDIAALAKLNRKGREVIERMIYLKEAHPYFAEWYATDQGQPMRDARSRRSDADFCRTKLKPIILCYEGKCVTTTSATTTSVTSISATQNDDTNLSSEARFRSFLERNEAVGNEIPALVDLANERLYLSGWEKGCRCIIRSQILKNVT